MSGLSTDLMPEILTSGRFVCHFSCGAASAVATKIVLSMEDEENIAIYNVFIQEEHPDNRRFLADCERWFGHPVTVLRDEKYGASTHQIWSRKRFMKNRFSAPCSTHLKRDVLASVAERGDISVLGYTVEEEARAERLEDRFPNEKFYFPLIDKGLTKADCLAMIERAGIELPLMYRLGYDNANCIGCIKGGEGYWNKIRRDFPEQFVQIAEIQKSIGPGANLFRDRKTGERYSLYDLPPDRGRYSEEPSISCSFLCESVERDFTESDVRNAGVEL